MPKKISQNDGQKEIVGKYFNCMRTICWLSNLCLKTGARSLIELSRKSVITRNNPEYDHNQIKRFSQLLTFPNSDKIDRSKNNTVKKYGFDSSLVFNLGPQGIPLWGALGPDLINPEGKYSLPTVCDQWNWSFSWPAEVLKECNKRIKALNKTKPKGDSQSIDIRDIPEEHYQNRNIINDPHSVAVELGISEMPELTDWHYLAKSLILYHVAVQREESFLEIEKSEISLFDGDFDCEEEFGNDEFDDEELSNSESTENYKSNAELMEKDMGVPFVSVCDVSDKKLAQKYIHKYLNKLSDEIALMGLKKEHFIKFLELYSDPIAYPVEFDKKQICVLSKTN